MRPSLLFLGDSRERDLHKLMAPHVCSDDWLGFEWTLPAVQNPKVAGGATCRDGSRFAHIGYFVHYGVSSEPPYHDRGRDHGAGWSTHRHLNWSDEEEPSRVDSTQMILRAWSRFRSRVPRSSRVVTVLSSQAWDILRYVEHFPSQPSGSWVAEYATNTTSLARRLLVALNQATGGADGTLPRDALLLATSFHVCARIGPPAVQCTTHQV